MGREDGEIGVSVNSFREGRQFVVPLQGTEIHFGDSTQGIASLSLGLYSGSPSGCLETEMHGGAIRGRETAEAVLGVAGLMAHPVKQGVNGSRMFGVERCQTITLKDIVWQATN